jgi:excisionase family DNA binding protein
VFPLSQPIVHQEYLTTEQAAALLGFTRRALENLRYRRTGPPFVRVGPKAIRYSKARLHEWLSTRETGPDELAAERS